MQHSLTHTGTGADAFDALRVAVQYCWFQPARLLGRLDHWQDTLVAAFDAVLIDQGHTLVTFPEGATTSDGRTADTAEDVLNAFDEWLGGDAVWAAVETVLAS